MRVLVCGAGGAIGGHLVARLLADGLDVRAVDMKSPGNWWQWHDAADNRASCYGDMLDPDAVHEALTDVDVVYDLAADMGGISHITEHRFDCALSVRIATNLLTAAIDEGVSRFFFSSSACIYAADKQSVTAVTALREEDAWPAQPEAGYGEEKLFTEQLCKYAMEDYGLETRVARFHNVYGTHGSWRGGREKAPAAICRKVAEAKLSGCGHIEIWGDGAQTRSFMHVCDCVEGVRRITDSDVRYPINLGSSHLVTINEMVTIVEDIAGVVLDRKYLTDAPQGVRGRNSDNTRIRAELGWEPSTSLRDGLERLYPWVESQVRAAQ